MLNSPQDLAAGVLFNGKVSADLVEYEKFLGTTKLFSLGLWSRQHGSRSVRTALAPLEMAVMTPGAGNLLLLLESLQQNTV